MKNFSNSRSFRAQTGFGMTAPGYARQDGRLLTGMELTGRTGGGRNYGRLGIGGGAALIAFSHGRKALESMRYGEIGHTLIHGAIAGGAGYLGYHALTNSKQFRVGAGRLAQTLLNKNMKGNGGALTGIINSTANFLKSMR